MLETGSSGSSGTSCPCVNRRGKFWRLLLCLCVVICFVCCVSYLTVVGLGCVGSSLVEVCVYSVLVCLRLFVLRYVHGNVSCRRLFYLLICVVVWVSLLRTR